MNYEEIWKSLSDSGLKLVKTMESYLEVVNWAYVGFAIFGMLFLWMVFDSMMGSQMSPMLIICILAFIGIFFMFAMSMSKSLV